MTNKLKSLYINILYFKTFVAYKNRQFKITDYHGSWVWDEKKQWWWMYE